MKYRVEPIGAAFSKKDMEGLAGRFNKMSDEGWEFHSVFSIQQTGCLGHSQGTTYLAVYTKQD